MELKRLQIELYMTNRHCNWRGSHQAGFQINPGLPLHSTRPLPLLPFLALPRSTAVSSIASWPAAPLRSMQSWSNSAFMDPSSTPLRRSTRKASHEHPETPAQKRRQSASSSTPNTRSRSSSSDATEVATSKPNRFISHYGAKSVHDILSSLPVEAKSLVQEVGLGGLLRMPSICLVDRQFWFWLLSRVDPENMLMQLGNGQQIALETRSVDLILWVKAEGTIVSCQYNKRSRDLIGDVARIL